MLWPKMPLNEVEISSEEDSALFLNLMLRWCCVVAVVVYDLVLN